MSSTNTNLTAVFHKELIPDTQILSSFCGKFIPVLVNSPFYIESDFKIDQICVQYSSKLKIYGISKSKNKDEYNKLNLLNTYNVFDRIEQAEKFKSLTSKSLNSIILSLSSYKISIIEYDILYDNFTTLALYSIDKFMLSGKIKIEQSFKIMSSLTYNTIAFIFDENKISFLRKKSEKKILEENKAIKETTEENKKQKVKSLAYSDTIGGNKYFLPTIYLSDLNSKYNIHKIINIYIPKKNSEIFNFDEDNDEEPNKIEIYILYFENKYETSEEIKSDDNINNNNFMRDKINIGLLSYNLKDNEYIDFKILFSGIDENAFDFTILEKEDKNNIAVVFSAYNLQFINFKKKKAMNYITNDSYYNLIFSKLYNNPDKYHIGQLSNQNLDLRGGGYLVLNSDIFYFSDSQGKIFCVVCNDINNIRFEQRMKKNEKEYYQLGSPYNKILIPYGFIFFMSSPFADAVLVNLDPKTNNCNINDRIINYSPIINFHLVNDDFNNEIKFVFTHGYGENSYISYASRHFLFQNIQKFSPEINGDIDYMISINDSDNNNYTKFILCKLKSKKLIVLQSGNGVIIDISSQIEYNKDFNIVNFGEIYINNENNVFNEKLIVLIFETEIKFYNKNFVLFQTFNNNFITNNSFHITDSRVGENICLIYNTTEKKYFLFGLYDTKLALSNNKNNISEIMLSQNLFLRHKELSNFIFNDNYDFLKVNMIKKLFLNNYNLLMIYRNNTTIEIYDITHFLECNDNMLIDENEKENNFRLLLTSNKINYFPPTILDDNLSKNDLYRSASNINIDFSKSINDLFSIDNNEENENNNINKVSVLKLRNSLSFSIEYPEFIYFGNLGNLVVLALMFKSGELMFYKLYISDTAGENENTIVKSVGLKKILTTKLSDLDYREFFLKNIDNIFIPFDNINNKSGIIFNSENNMKIIYEVDGELCLLNFNDKINKVPWSSFCDFNGPLCPNGFLAYEDSSIKIYCLDIKYNLSNYSLLVRTDKIGRFPSILTYTPQYINTLLYYNYILIEKEMISANQFQYYLTIRNEGIEYPLNQIKFELNEIITECTVIDLQTMTGNNNTKKYIALGVTKILDNENLINSKIRLYEFNQEANYKLDLEIEKEGFKGPITIIQNLYTLNNLNNLVLIGEGSKLNVYQFEPDEKSKFNIKNINIIYADNKNMAISNRLININRNKLLLTGDILNSFNFMYIRPNMNVQNQIDIHSDSKDNKNIRVTSCDFWNIYNKKYCLIFDEDKNGYIYLLETNNNFRICDFKINKYINEIRTRGQNELPIISYYSSSNGSIGLIQHIENEIYEKLSYLCEFIYFHFPFNSGVNPSLYYSINYVNDDRNNYQKSKGRFIDKTILDIFLTLSDKFQDAICNNVLLTNKNEILKMIEDLVYS